MNEFLKSVRLFHQSINEELIEQEQILRCLKLAFDQIERTKDKSEELLSAETLLEVLIRSLEKLNTDSFDVSNNFEFYLFDVEKRLKKELTSVAPEASH